MSGDALSQLRRYRDLRRRRDELIRQAAQEGFHPAKIAVAAGLTVRHVQRIVQ